MPTTLFKHGELTEGEESFVHNVLNDDKTVGTGTLYMQEAQVLVSLKLAKEIEKSTKSSNKSSNVIIGLTIALALSAIIQAIQIIVSWIK